MKQRSPWKLLLLLAAGLAMGACGGDLEPLAEDVAPLTAECENDSDCSANYYCYTGVAGIGDNHCRPKKDGGQTCSRHGQCESDCCKLHIPTHPVSKTCRPESACD